MVLTASFVLSPVTGLYCHRCRPDAKHRRQLSASVGAPGPHDFAVRLDSARLAPPTRPPHPAPNVRDDRDTPLFKRGGTAGISKAVSTKRPSQIFLRAGLDRRANHLGCLWPWARNLHSSAESALMCITDLCAHCPHRLADNVGRRHDTARIWSRPQMAEVRRWRYLVPSFNARSARS